MSKYADRLAGTDWGPEHGTCVSCGADLVLRDGKFGEFLGCSAFPDCTYTQSVEDRHERGDFGALGRDADGHHY